MGTPARRERDRLQQLTGRRGAGATPRQLHHQRTNDARRKRLRIVMKSREIMALEESLGYRFQRRELIEQALTHSSQARELQAAGATQSLAGSGDNELLEFLGDAVLGLVTSEALFHRFPDVQRGPPLQTPRPPGGAASPVASRRAIEHRRIHAAGTWRGAQRRTRQGQPPGGCAGSDSGGTLPRWRVDSGARLHLARHRRTRIGAHAAGYQRHAGDGLQVGITGGAAGHREAAAGVRFGEERKARNTKRHLRSKRDCRSREWPSLWGAPRARPRSARNRKRLARFWSTFPSQLRGCGACSARKMQCSHVVERKTSVAAIGQPPFNRLPARLSSRFSPLRFWRRRSPFPPRSMEQTLLIGDYLLVDKLCYGNGGIWERLLPYRKIRRGDIVVFHYPVNPAQAFVKRVVAVPGDRLRLINKRVYVNGTAARRTLRAVHHERARTLSRRLSPHRIRGLLASTQNGGRSDAPPGRRDHQLIIPEGHYFVLGDNRDDSQDSRYWGFVPRENIIGRPMMIYWSSTGLSNDLTGSPTVGDRLYHLAYGVTHVFQITRWGRTFRLVR